MQGKSMGARQAHSKEIDPPKQKPQNEKVNNGPYLIHEEASWLFYRVGCVLQRITPHTCRELHCPPKARAAVQDWASILWQLNHSGRRRSLMRLK